MTGFSELTRNVKVEAFYHVKRGGGFKLKETLNSILSVMCMTYKVGVKD